MNFKDLMENLEALAPQKFTLANDKTGFQVGRLLKKISKVLLATDITDDIIAQAVAENADLILTHHPLIYDPLTQITESDLIGRRILKLIRNDINYMAMHTNFDVRGMADYAADILELSSREIFIITYEKDGLREGLGRYGKLPFSMTLNECADYVKSKFNIDSVKIFGNGGKVINTAAISPGSSSGILTHAIKANVDLLITGDIKHEMALAALDNGISLIDAGHYATEKIFVPYLADYFKREMPEIEVFNAKESNPFYVI
ncbi:MAG: Nif3-like dinuclear metal center hexameric protein [Lachnospiraceae bacterium]|nr:Nif3-like dinuclear metal center hexameric protein [Lachnospiraceae bacterium]